MDFTLSSFCRQTYSQPVHQSNSGKNESQGWVCRRQIAVCRETLHLAQRTATAMTHHLNDRERT